MVGDTRKELDAWLGAAHTNTAYDISLQKRLPGTCDWILSRDVFCDWKSACSPSETAKILWINGPAGYGKTVLSASIIEHLKAQSNSITAFSFFSADLEDRADPSIVVRSWVSQVISQSRDAFELAWEMYESQDARTASPKDAIGLFQELVYKVPGCFFIVDGLDECTSKGGWSAIQSNSLATFVGKTMRAVSGTSSHMLIVSREDQDIRDGLSDSASKSAGLKLAEYKISPEDVKPDAITLSKCIVDQKLGNKSQTIRAELAQRMVDRCGSMLLRIRLLENDLRGGKSQRQLERIVDQTPTELNHLYDRNWTRITERETDRNRAFAILRWAALALRPITILEVTEALLVADTTDTDELEEELPDAVDEHYVKTEILNLCASLVEIRAAASSTPALGHQTLHLSHFTVRQYVLHRLPVPGGHLRANENLRSSDESIQRNILAETCLRYLCIPQLWDCPQEHDRDAKLSWNFRDYAATFWYQYVTGGCSNYEVVMKAIIAFFCQDNVNWEGWRRHHEAAYIETKFPTIRFLGELTPVSPLFYASLLGLQGLVIQMVELAGIDVNDTDESSRTALLAAAAEGNSTLVQYLLEKGADVNLPSSEGRTPLYVATVYGHTGIAKLILEKGADVAVTEMDGRAAMHNASSTGNIDLMKLLLEKGADLNVANNNGRTPLDYASAEGHIDAVELLLENGADWAVSDNEGWTPLNSASAGGYIEAVKMILNKGADPNVSNNDGLTPLHSASARGYSDIVELLLECGADWTVSESDGLTPLISASANGHIDTIRLLLDAGADKDAQNTAGWTPLNCAAATGCFDVVELLLAEGADWRIPNIDGWTPLHSAVSKGYIGMVNLLLEGESTVDSKDIYGQTPLSLAAEFGHEPVLEQLLKSESNIDSKDNEGWTALSRAANNGFKSMVKLLLDNGAQPDLKDNSGRTPLWYAAGRGYESTVQLLLDNNAAADAKDHYGSTPLSIAARFGYEIVVDKLSALPTVDALSEDKFGRTPLWWAQKQGHTSIVEVLVHCTEDLGDATTGGLPLGPPSIFDTKIGIYCDVCLFAIFKNHYHCDSCNGGNFDICSECRGLGAHCNVASHHLTFRNRD